MIKGNKMKKYSAFFERYDFTNGTKKIIFKNVMLNGRLHVREAYMDAMRVPYLIGNLVMGEKVKFLANINTSEIINPIQVEY